MFLHLGGEQMVKLKDVIMIINMENGLKNNNLVEFLKSRQSQEVIEKVDENSYKSIVVTEKNIYYSPISSQTLKKRASFITDSSE